MQPKFRTYFVWVSNFAHLSVIFNVISFFNIMNRTNLITREIIAINFQFISFNLYFSRAFNHSFWLLRSSLHVQFYSFEVRNSEEKRPLFYFQDLSAGCDGRYINNLTFRLIMNRYVTQLILRKTNQRESACCKLSFYNINTIRHIE